LAGLAKDKDHEEERRIERFTREKEALDQEKKDREEARTKAKLQSRQSMIDKQIDSLRALQDN